MEIALTLSIMALLSFVILVADTICEFLERYMDARKFRLAQRLARRAQAQSNSKKWDVANRLMAKAAGRK